MTFGLTAALASFLVLGVLSGWWLKKWQLDARTKRQTAAQLFLYRQLQEHRAVRRDNHPGTPDAEHLANPSHHRAA